MPNTIKTRPGLINAFRSCSDEVQEYFEHLPGLVSEFPLDVCLAYMFSRLELGQNMALYCGIAKRHKGEANLTWQTVRTHHMTREEFLNKYEIVFEAKPPQAALRDMKAAEKVRDAVMHGKRTSDGDLRNAAAHVFRYAEAINSQLQKIAGFKPFRKDLRGFKGRLQSLDKSTTRWILKGMGFDLS